MSLSRTRRIQLALDRCLERGDYAGYAAVVHHRGREELAFAGGTHKRGSIVRIASMTKPIMAAAAMTFVEDGTFRVHDPIQRWLPELADRRVLRDPLGSPDDTVPSPRAITLHDLLSFQLGIGWGPSSVMPRAFALMTPPLALDVGSPVHTDLPPDAWLAKLAEIPLAYAPGERWLYHVASDLLGVLLARVAAQPLEAVLRERIFEPLGMVDTFFSVPADKLARLAPLYAPARAPATGLAVRDAAPDSKWATPPNFPSGGGGLLSTVDDFQRFARMLLGGGALDGTRVLSRKSVEWMSTDHLSAAQHAHPGSGAIDRFDDDRSQMWANQGFGYGMAVRVRRAGLGPSAGTLTWPGAFGTFWFADPAEQLCATFVPQVVGGNPYYTQHASDFTAAVYQAIAD